MFDEMDVMSRLQTNQGAQKAQWTLRLGDSLWVLQGQALASSFVDGFDASPSGVSSHLTIPASVNFLRSCGVYPRPSRGPTSLISTFELELLIAEAIVLSDRPMFR
jgi:hypothetical protein